MWIYFNRRGAVETYLEYGSNARVDSNDFQIFAFIEDLDEKYSSAYITLRKPDLQETVLPKLDMFVSRQTFYARKAHTTNYDPFVDKKRYKGFCFDFADFDKGQENTPILDIPGKWHASIELKNADGLKWVLGVIEFNVEGRQYGEQTSETISTDIIIESLSNQLDGKLNINSRKYIKVVRSSDEIIKNIDLYNFEADEGTGGDIIFDKSTNKFYKLISFSVNEFDEYTLQTEPVKIAMDNIDFERDCVVMSDISDLTGIMEGGSVILVDNYELGNRLFLTNRGDGDKDTLSIMPTYTINSGDSLTIQDSPDEKTLVIESIPNNGNEMTLSSSNTELNIS